MVIIRDKHDILSDHWNYYIFDQTNYLKSQMYLNRQWYNPSQMYFSFEVKCAFIIFNNLKIADIRS